MLTEDFNEIRKNITREDALFYGPLGAIAAKITKKSDG